jgi:hypothetical protein
MLDRMLLASASDEKLFVEEVFQTHLYTGNGSTQTITNGIDLAGKGGMVWCKSRSSPESFKDHVITDTARGATVALIPNNSAGNNIAGYISALNQFNSNGFSLNGTPTPPSSGYPGTWSNQNGQSYASWTFRKAPKFFDVVTYTGNGVAGRQIAHNLGVAPGMIIVKQTNGTEDWRVYHRSTGNGQTLTLNTTAAAGATSIWNSTSPTSTNFTVGASPAANGNGDTYVAYLFAHDPSADGIIQCGSFTTDGSGNVGTVNLGWEPQWVLFKRADGTGSWITLDNMRGFNQTGQNALYPNTSDAEYAVSGNFCFPTATGFSGTGNFFGMNANMVYIAIRRGPMKTPTLGTSVFAPVSATPSSGSQVVTTNFPVDFFISAWRNAVLYKYSGSRLTAPFTLQTNATSAETNWGSYAPTYASNTSFVDNNVSPSAPWVWWNFRRAPGFFDVVCYTGTGVARTVNHNLGVAPELMIVKSRSTAARAWMTYTTATGATQYLMVQSTNASATGSFVWNDTAPTSSNFTVGAGVDTNESGSTFVAYLFASCPGVSKVGSYTGNGSSQTINCAFTTGARFVLIKRTDSTGDWYVWDSARGIVAGNDPYLALNTTAAEVTTNDSVDTDNTGFIVNQVAASNVNVNAATYIFLAIA